MRIVHGLSLVLVVALAGTALAQRPADPANPTRPAAGRPAAGVEVEAATAQASTADEQIAALLYACCRNEVEISKFAQNRLQSEAARQFAEQMIAEHTAACQKLEKFAGNAVDARLGAAAGAATREERREERIERREERREDVPRPATPRIAAEPGRGLEIEAGGARVQIQPGARPAADIDIRRNAAGGLNWVSIHQQIADQCLASTKQEFASKEGAELDHCYVAGQIMGHQKALDEIKVLRKYASPELRAQLDACSQGCAEHLKEAKALAKQLEGDVAASRVSRKPATAPAANPE